MRIKQSEFIISAVKREQYPIDNRVEIAGIILELACAVVEVTENDVTIWDRTRSECNTSRKGGI